ncbi:MAG: Druantia anti-phage system protein DruA [Pedobacter sp.]
MNNVRFLILPWVRVEHLASKALATNLRVLVRDWQRFYSQEIALAETFVDTERYQGTCYKAANWNRIGETKGRGKYDRENRYAASVKAVYLYPLTKYFREHLNG